MSGELDHVAALRSEVAGFADLLAEIDPEAPVPTLGRWRVRDVVAHLGGVHRWATRVVTERSLAGPGFTKSKLRGEELTEWFLDGLEPLVAALDVDADEPCPNFNPGSASTMRFWQRRQLHETTVHRWDIQRGGGVVGEIPVDVADDAIDEFLDVFVRTRGKQPLVGPLVLSTPTGGHRALRPDPAKPGRVLVDPDGGADVGATVEGVAPAVLLYCWGRWDLDEAGLLVVGDDEIARSFRAR